MNEPNFASLSPTLLARKGGAKPAMRPQLGPIPSAANAAHSLEDLGWNDMGEEGVSHHEAEVVALTPAPSNPETAAEAKVQDRAAGAALHSVTGNKPEVLRQQNQIVTALAVKQAVRLPAKVSLRKPASESGRRAAFTLRLDAERHLRLRLATTLRGRSAQQLVTEALDLLLRDMTDVDTLAAQVRTAED